MKDDILTLRATRYAAAIAACALLSTVLGCGSTETRSRHRTFSSPEAAVDGLTQALKKGSLDELREIFGPDSQALIDSSDPVGARRNREIFTAAVAETWRLEDVGQGKTLVIGNEEWPFPIPIVKDGNAWRFDTAAGKEEVLARRIGRNELAAIRICHTYVAAQQLYARTGHDGTPRGFYAARFRSDPGQQNGLYWPAAAGEKHSPLGDLIAHASAERIALTRKKDDAAPSPFHGYYFKILTAQGPAATGGAMDYMAGGKLWRGFALVAWPAQYDVTGIMTFLVNQDGKVHEKDLGSGTDAAARAMTVYNPDVSWASVQ